MNNTAGYFFSNIQKMYQAHTDGLPVYIMPQPFHPHFHLLVVLNIDHSLLPLASRDVTLEQDVNLAIGSTLHLRQEEVRQKKANKTGSTPDVAALTAEVRLLYFVSNCLLRGVKKGLTVGLSM